MVSRLVIVIPTVGLIGFIGWSLAQPPQRQHSPEAGRKINLAVDDNQALPIQPHKIATEHLSNAIQVHDRVISGGLPEGDAAFAELRDLGIKTIISVDGATPDVETAHRFGLRYVHLPHGYNGVTPRRIQELAKAVRDLGGPVYIHCHHGKHRSPTAAAVACVAIGLLPPTAALSVLKVGGTSEGYLGLYAAAGSAQRLNDAQLDELQVEFVERAELPPMAERMVALEQIYNKLQRQSAHHWTMRFADDQLSAAHQALMLSEQFTEILRMPEVIGGDVRYGELFEQSQVLARKLENALRPHHNRNSGVSGSIDSAAADAALENISQACGNCHRRYRDQPLTGD